MKSIVLDVPSTGGTGVTYALTITCTVQVELSSNGRLPVHHIRFFFCVCRLKMELQTVYVKGFPSIVTEEDVRELFSACGKILQINWDTNKR